MKVYSAEKIKNIVIAGHGSRGKTSLAEAMLFFAGATDRLGKVSDGNTVMDCDAEEKARKVSVSTALAPLEYNGYKVNLTDTPGLFDFAGGISEGLRAGDCALIVTAAGSGYDVGAEKVFKAADALKMSRMVAITKVDAENADFYKTIGLLREVHGSKICPVVVPYMQGDRVEAYVNLISKKAYKYDNGKASEIPMPGDEFVDEMNSVLCEAVASQDDDMMEKFFENAGADFTEDEIIKGLATGVADCSLIPVFACSGFTMGGIDILVKAITEIAPSAKTACSEKAVDEKGGEVTVECDENAPLAAICFKTVADPFVGKMSFIKVISGKLTSDAQVFNMRTGENERIGKLVTVRGNKQEEASAIVAGDIGVVTKLANVITGDTLCSVSRKLELKKISFPAPCLSMAVKVRKKGEEEKVAAGLSRLMEEDPTITYKNNTETREQVLSGLGEQHLAVIVSKLKQKFGVEVDLTVPKVAYRETIRKKVEVQGRHKKQSGGHGQFGDVFIRFEPCEEEELVFAEEIFGGSVPKNFFPAVEKGLRECTSKGTLAGYPMVGIKATLYDGSYHPVDSSEMAFKTAAAIAFKNGIPDANPVLLEPIGTLKAYMPDDKMGDIMGDITKRRGRMLGMGPASSEEGIQELIAEVPMAEMGDFATVLRSVTAGKGYFNFEFARYEEAPQNITIKVVEQRKAELAES